MVNVVLHSSARIEKIRGWPRWLSVTNFSSNSYTTGSHELLKIENGVRIWWTSSGFLICIVQQHSARLCMR